MRTFLTLDLDFFNECSNQILPLLRKIKNLNVETYLIESHEDCLPYIDVNDKLIINIDTHSDFAALSSFEKKEYCYSPHCGNWVDFIARQDRNFLWIHPKKFHRCDSTDESFERLGKFNWIRETNNTNRAFQNTNITSIVISASIMDCYTERSVIELIYNTDWIMEWFEKIWIKPTLNVCGRMVSNITWKKFLDYILN
jgi:hypothetical protein